MSIPAIPCSRVRPPQSSEESSHKLCSNPTHEKSAFMSLASDLTRPVGSEEIWYGICDERCDPTKNHGSVDAT